MQILIFLLIGLSYAEPEADPKADPLMLYHGYPDPYYSRPYGVIGKRSADAGFYPYPSPTNPNNPIQKNPNNPIQTNPNNPIQSGTGKRSADAEPEADPKADPQMLYYGYPYSYYSYPYSVIGKRSANVGFYPYPIPTCYLCRA